MTRREFRLKDAKSDKFWAIEVEGAAHTVHFGRVGTNGQRKTKEFDDAAAAAASAAKLIASKVKKGYAEVDGGDAQTWNNRGVCLWKLERADEARSCFENALKLDPQDEDAQFNLQNLA